MQRGGRRIIQNPNPRHVGRPEHYFDEEVVANYHERYSGGAGYHAWRARWKHARKSKLLRDWAQGATRVLDVACGPGRFHGSYPGAHVVGVDRSLTMLRRYQRDHPGAQLAVADAVSLPFPDDSFDVVVATRFITHLRGDYRAAVLKEFARVSRGWVMVDGRHPYNLRFLWRRLRFWGGLAKADKLRQGYGTLRDELAAAGLRVERMRSIAWGLSARVLICAAKEKDAGDCGVSGVPPK